MYGRTLLGERSDGGYLYGAPNAESPVENFILVTGLSGDLIVPGELTVFAADFVADPGGYSDFEVKRSSADDSAYAVSIVFNCTDVPPSTIDITIRATTPSTSTGETTFDLTDSNAFCGGA